MDEETSGNLDSVPAGRAVRPGRIAAVVGLTIALVLVLILVLVLTERPAAAQSETPEPTEQAGLEPAEPEPIPCEVAMVVGCVATVEGENGTSTVTLQISNSGTEDTDEPAETRSLDELAAEEQRADDRPLQSGLDPWERGGLRANFGTNSIPISQYQIGADVTGWLGVPDPLDSFVASQTNWAFTTATFLVILSTNALDWAFEFPLAEDLIGDAGVLAQDYSVEYFGFGLSTSIYSLALSVTMIVAGFKAVTKGVIAAGSEVFLAVIAYVILIVLTVTAGFGNAGLSVARVSSDLSSGIASFAAGQQRQEECATAVQAEQADGGSETVEIGTSSACTFGFAVQRSLVELPYQNLQWGQVLDGVEGKEQCAAINLELLAEGPWGNSDEPRDRMRAVPECEENADFNHEASYIRLGIASANSIAAATVTLLLLAVSAMLLWQQIKLLFLTVTMPHALVFAILPGRSRRMAWLWIEHLIGVVIRTVILSLGLVVWLSLFSLIVHEQLTVRGIFLSLFASVAMAVSGFYGLYRLGTMSRRINPAAEGRKDRPRTTVVSDGGGTAPVRPQRTSGGSGISVRSVKRGPNIGGGRSSRLGVNSVPGDNRTPPPPSPSSAPATSLKPSWVRSGTKAGR